VTEKKVVTVTEEKTAAACCLEGLIEETEKRNATPEVVASFTVEEICCGMWHEVCDGQITKGHDGHLTASFTFDGDAWEPSDILDGFRTRGLRIR
jgi:hypothetical protein